MLLRSFKGRIVFLLLASLIFFASILFVVADAIIRASLDNEEQALLRSRLLEFYALYQSGNLNLLENENFSERLYREERAYVVRIAGRDNQTRFLSAPSQWRNYPFEILERIYSPGEGQLIRLKIPQTTEELIFSSLVLPDQNILQVGLSSSQKEKTLTQFRTAYFLTLIPLLSLCALISAFFASRFLRPVSNLIKATRTITLTGQIEQRIPDLRGGDELAELTRYFNAMLDRLENLIQSMRESLDQVAHDLRTPLTRLRIKAEKALTGKASKEVLASALKDCLKESASLLKLLENLLAISQAEAGLMHLNKVEEDLSAFLLDLSDFFQYLAEEKNIRLQPRIEKNLLAHFDPNRLRQALANLLENAIKYSPSHRQVIVKAVSNALQIVIEISDEGPGFAPEEVPYIFKRFYRAKGPKEVFGFGLGLYLAKTIIEAHGGQISVASTPGLGTTFRVVLPRH